MLNYQSPFLVDHGDKVGFLTAGMMRAKGGVPDEYISECYVAGMLHDIGAFKTEEVNPRLDFDSGNIWNHSAYGYLFTQNTESFSFVDDAILYHHIDWERLKKTGCRNPLLTNVLYLADRIEIFHRNNRRAISREELEPARDIRFASEVMDMFIDADLKYRLQERILDSSYILDTERYMQSIYLPKDVADKYLHMAAFCIDFLSEDTVAHTITTVSISVELGRLLNFSDEDMLDTYYGSYLHDLGKIAIPKNIIEKPGALSPGEMEIMKTHVVHTGRIIRGEVNETVYQIAVRHHERLDGSGYPFGYGADRLTVKEQVVAVADVCSALMSRRSYKEGYPRDRILGILKDMAKDEKISLKLCQIIEENYDVIMANTERNCGELIGKYRDIKSEYERLSKIFVEIS